MSLEPEQPHHGHHKTGVNWLDLALAFSAILISLTSLVITIVHSRAIERMADANTKLVEANSWPFVSYATGLLEDSGMVYVGLVNKGVGPAKIETVELKWKGAAYPNASEFLNACCGYKSDPQHLATGAVQVLRAGDQVTLFGIAKSPDNEDVRDRFNRARLSANMSLNVCYCSVFDECWKADLVRYTMKRERVAQCEPPRVALGFSP